jgi:hypothetical protein
VALNSLSELYSRERPRRDSDEAIPKKTKFAELENYYDSDPQYLDFTFSPSSDRAFDSG